MGARVKLVRQPSEVRALHQMRHDVFVEPGHYPPMGDQGLLFDFFDTVSTTDSFLAWVGHEVVGGVRLTVDSEVGLPTDNVLDLRTGLPSASTLAVGSLFGFRRNRANASPRVVRGLLKLLFYRAQFLGCTHLGAALNPALLPMLSRVGMQPIGPKFTARGLPTVPMLADLADLSPDFKRFFQQNRRIPRSVETFERRFFVDGERMGGPGEVQAFVLTEGEATNGEQRFSMGERIVSSADVVAIGSTDVLVLESPPTANGHAHPLSVRTPVRTTFDPKMPT